LLTALENTPGALAVLPFDRLDPRYKALTIDGVNVLSNRFNVLTYPLAVALTVEGAGASAVRALVQDVVQPYTNRNPARLTQLIMTGVTAMSRVTAVRMDQKGYDYPAQVISDVFAAADITHISNEVPFLDDCVANPAENNLILCSDTDYWAALAALGADIVGLSGNHVNDFGREGARRSLTWYHDNGIPIYGSGFNVNEACAPLLWEDHGNTFAFIAALAFYPENAWATADQPGACYYYDNRETILALVQQLAGLVDIVAVWWISSPSSCSIQRPTNLFPSPRRLPIFVSCAPPAPTSSPACKAMCRRRRNLTASTIRAAPASSPTDWGICSSTRCGVGRRAPNWPHATRSMQAVYSTPNC